MRLFGTDGIRGNPEESPIRETKWIGASFGMFLGRGKKVLVCRDTRESGETIQKKFVSGLISSGIEVLDAGILNTPAAAYMVKKLALDGAGVVTASHNPAPENGIKFFNSKGQKLSEKDEERIEELFFSNKESDLAKGTLKGVEPIEYVEFAKSMCPKGMKVVVDCANGAAYKTALAIFNPVKAIIINNNPNGKNINSNCGSEHPEKLASRVIREKADLGVALDGDGDRAVLVDEKGNVLNGDHVIGIAAIGLAREGKLQKNSIVVTHYSSYGLEKTLGKLGIEVIRSDVGDQKVASEMDKKGLNLGGEQSGHIIFSEILPTGDGIITALIIMQIMKSQGKKLSELAAQITMVPQKMINVKVKEKKPLESVLLSKSIKEAKDILEGKGRVFVRYSGTQNLLRIMVEGENEKQINKIAQELAKEAENELGK